MPIAAAVPALIGAAGAVGGGLLGGSMGRGNTGAARGLLEATGNSANQAGNTNIANATKNLSNVGNFYQTLMSGNQQQIQQLLAPEINSVNQQYNQAYQSGAQLQPRSGMTAAANASLPFQKEATIGNAILSAPLSGASGLAGIGSAQGGLGSQLFNTSTGAGSALGNIGLGISQQGMQGAAGGYTLGNNLGIPIQQGVQGLLNRINPPSVIPQGQLPMANPPGWNPLTGQ